MMEVFLFEGSGFCLNANYRYWNMIGVKTIIRKPGGSGGEIEPVYDQYTISFFLFHTLEENCISAICRIDGSGSSLRQELEDGYLP
jgi:hypothetical protein